MIADVPVIPAADRRTAGQLADYSGFHRDTITSWMKKGIDAPDGRFKLRSQKLGGFRYSTLAWFREFLEKTNEMGHGDPVSETPAAAEARAQKDQEKARKKLGGK